MQRQKPGRIVLRPLLRLHLVSVAKPSAHAMSHAAVFIQRWPLFCTAPPGSNFIGSEPTMFNSGDARRSRRNSRAPGGPLVLRRGSDDPHARRSLTPYCSSIPPAGQTVCDSYCEERCSGAAWRSVARILLCRAPASKANLAVLNQSSSMPPLRLARTEPRPCQPAAACSPLFVPGLILVLRLQQRKRT